MHFDHALQEQLKRRDDEIETSRSKNRSSAFRSDGGKRTYIITTRRITSGDELK
jgi:hypothetical protein